MNACPCAVDGDGQADAEHGHLFSVWEEVTETARVIARMFIGQRRQRRIWHLSVRARAPSREMNTPFISLAP